MRKIVFQVCGMVALLGVLAITGCTHDADEVLPEAELMLKAANASPSWKADARCFYDGAAGTFDDVAVKDPSIVQYGGKWHLFYTGRDKGPRGSWRMGYTTATYVQNFQYMPHFYMSSLNGGSYFCAPQVFYFAPKGKWYLVYQSGLGATYSTNNTVETFYNWSAGKAMGFTDGIDFWCISDGARVYCFYSAQDGSHTIKRRSTSIANFPTGWSSPSVVATGTFEAPHVYKSKADGQYYMVVEDISRYQELWTASALGGIWTKVSERWAAKSNLSEPAGHWTDQVSHVEILRSGYDEKMEIADINRCDMLIQGVVNGNYPDYGSIPYDLGLIRNY